MLDLIMGAVFILLLCIIVLLAYVSFRLYGQLVGVEDAVYATLDACDELHVYVSDVLEMPVAMNTPEIGDVLIRLRKVKDALQKVATTLGVSIDATEEDDV